MKIKGGNVRLKGEFKVPGDKSISHRAIMIGSLAEGKTVISNFLMGEDCLSTIRCFREMGVEIEAYDDKVIVNGVGLKGLKKPYKKLDVGNSGTTIRLMSGILAAQKFPSIIEGDESIMKRPMDRIIVPLRLMGADIKGLKDKYPPLVIQPVESLDGIYYRQPVASAQVKSCILLAGLYANGNVSIIQPSPSRDHTERMLQYFGLDININGKSITLEKRNRLYGRDIFVPGDISSAAFFIVGALILKDSVLTIKDVGLNQTRTGIIDVFKGMGGNIKVSNYRVANNEPIGDISVECSRLKGITIGGDIIPRLIDEIPIIAVAASLAQGTTVIRNAEELKIKESNRLRAIVNELRKMNVEIEELEDGMIIKGPNKIRAAELNTYNDHRMAMALSILALCAEGQSIIKDSSSIDISFPNFYEILEYLKR